ncbi:uncharacterized protein ATNIH1004_007659 [Aspergillus tanneri]|uniref:Mucin-2 n=1 Tax=Aspergillus tanneri TaxID=1220188 RepID=A0A5M9MGX3_9EURO|nr:Mucin-2 [Aspergillus tanneri]KAA8646232.1 Mucin-2 [Aspergillus tanneri]
MGFANDAMEVLDGFYGTNAVIEEHSPLYPGLFPRDGVATVTVTDTICATLSPPAFSATTFSTATQAPPTASVTSLTASVTENPPISSETHGNPGTGTVVPPVPSVSSSDYSSESASQTAGIPIPPVSTVSSGEPSGTSYVSSQTTTAAPSVSTTGEHSSTYPVSSQTTGTETAGTTTAPTSAPSSTASPAPNAGVSHGEIGMHAVYLALGMTLVCFVAI